MLLYWPLSMRPGQHDRFVLIGLCWLYGRSEFPPPPPPPIGRVEEEQDPFGASEVSRQDLTELAFLTSHVCMAGLMTPNATHHEALMAQPSKKVMKEG